MRPTLVIAMIGSVACASAPATAPATPARPGEAARSTAITGAQLRIVLRSNAVVAATQASQARRAASDAGDAGYVRLRAMALLMLSRIAGPSDEGRDAHARATAIAEALDAAISRDAPRVAGSVATEAHVPRHHVWRDDNMI